MIKGWDEGILGMKPGGKRKLIVPSKLAYGKQGRGILIPADADLVFEVEMLRHVVTGKSQFLQTLSSTTSRLVGGDEVQERAARWKTSTRARLKSNGSKFDSSLDWKARRAPFPVTVGTGMVIQGWDQGSDCRHESGRPTQVIDFPVAVSAMENAAPATTSHPTPIWNSISNWYVSNEASRMMNMTGRISAVALAAWCLLAAGCGKRAVVTPSGLEMADVSRRQGRGGPPKRATRVEIHYTGWLQADNSQFDTSRDKKPYLFRLGIGQVIKGWDEGIVGMRPDGTRKLFVPSAMAFGNIDQGILLPPNSDLVFEIDLLRIIKGFKTEELRAGTGQEAQWLDVVKVRYTGWLKEGGKEFENNYDKDAPYVFRIGGRKDEPLLIGGRELKISPVIKGWEGGVVGMKVGSKRKIIIPAELGYGKNPIGLVPADADLIFDVELIDIVTEYQTLQPGGGATP